MKEKVIKRIISREEYQQICGLLYLAAVKSKEMSEISKSLREITREKDDNGHCSDATYCDYSAEDLMDRLNLVVDKKKRTK